MYAAAQFGAYFYTQRDITGREYAAGEFRSAGLDLSIICKENGLAC